MEETLSRRALNRATLHRQLLLERSDRSVVAVVEHLVGMQAQNPLDPYFGLWARLDRFDPDELGSMTRDGSVVRGQFMRGTIHLFSAEDGLGVHPITADVLRRVFNSTQFSKDIAGIELQALLEAARSLMQDSPLSRAELGKALVRAWPGYPPGSLAQAATYLLPVVQVPPRGVWGETSQARWTTFESFLARPYGPGTGLDDVVLRYLRAFGPASVGDMRTWSGLTGLREVVDRLRPRLRIYRDEVGTELLDVEEADLPDPDTPAPPRLLPEYDNVLLGHADRSRFFPDEETPAGWVGNVLVDGQFGGSWKRDGSSLLISLTPRAGSEEDAVGEEAERLARLAWPDREMTIRFSPT